MLAGGDSSEDGDEASESLSDFLLSERAGGDLGI
jgi:hypothetical protein